MQSDDRAAEYIGRMKEEGVCYNLCFPLSRSLPRHVTLLDEDTVDDDEDDDDGKIVSIMMMTITSNYRLALQRRR